MFNLLAHYPPDCEPLLAVSEKAALLQILKSAAAQPPSGDFGGGPELSLLDLVAGLGVRADPTLPDDLEPLDPPSAEPVPADAD